MSLNTEALLPALEAIGAFLLMGYLGYHLMRRGWFTDGSASMLSRLATQITIPVNLLYCINTYATKEQYLPLLHHVIVPAASIMIAMGLAAAIASATGIKRGRRNIFVTTFSCSNTINIGLPLNLALFGDESLPAVLIYYMANTTMFWTVGNYLLASDADASLRVPICSRETLRRIFCPPILAFLAGLALLVLDVRIPPVLELFGRHVGGMTTPLAVMCIGIAICQTGIRNIRLDRDVMLVAFGRFVASPLILAALMRFFPVPEMMWKVFIIQSSLPAMSIIALVSINYRTDSNYAATAVSFSTLCAAATVPAFMMLVG